MKTPLPRLLFYGDSNTYGYDPGCGRGSGGRYPEDSRWPDLVGKALAGRWQVLTDALPGRCIPEMKFEWAAWEDCVRTLVPLDRIAVMLGTNDYLSHPPDPAFVAGRMERFVSRARKNPLLQGTSWLILAPPWLDFGDDRWYRPYTTTDGLLSRALEECAARLGTGFVDTGAWNLPLAPDGIHLSPEGHRQLACHLLEILEAQQTAGNADP